MVDGEPKDFIISFREGNIKVGPVGGEPFMEWTDPEPWKVRFYNLLFVIYMLKLAI